jgi:hypothetical protein
MFRSNDKLKHRRKVLQIIIFNLLDLKKTLEC